MCIDKYYAIFSTPNANPTIGKQIANPTIGKQNDESKL